MNKFSKRDLVIVSDGGKDRNGMVLMRDGAVPYEAYIVLMQDNGEQEEYHVSKLRPHASDSRIALDIVRSLKAIQEQRRRMIEEYDKIERLMTLDGQAVWELEAIRSMRTVTRSMNRYEIGFLLGSWESYYDERKRK